MAVSEGSEERVVATMPVHGPTKQPFGVLHGGASVVLAQTVASLGTCNLIDQESQLAMELEINANHIPPRTMGSSPPSARRCTREEDHGLGYPHYRRG
jgi:1,4-dihydroxy-2-naphthoyl-CoA hydrolase